MAHAGGEGPGKVEAGDVDRRHVAAAVARDPGPRAVAGGGVPGGEGGLWVVGDGGFQGEECPVFRYAEWYHRG